MSDKQLLYPSILSIKEWVDTLENYELKEVYFSDIAKPRVVLKSAKPPLPQEACLRAIKLYQSLGMQQTQTYYNLLSESAHHQVTFKVN